MVFKRIIGKEAHQNQVFQYLRAVQVTVLWDGFRFNEYRNDIGSYTYELTSESIYVWAGSLKHVPIPTQLGLQDGPVLSFYYEDCAYVMVQSSTDGTSWGAFEFLPRSI